jgi:hypothetical protein
MKAKIATVLIAGQLAIAAQPVVAAELIDERAETMRRGAFAGARIRLPLGETREKAQMGLALTSTLRSDQTAELRFAKGVELGLAGNSEKVRLSIGGTPVSSLAPVGGGPEGAKKGISTLAGVAIGIGVAAVIAFVIYGEIGDAATE